MTATAVPQPLAIDGVVDNDPAGRILTVRRSELANAYARLWWRQGYQALVAAEESSFSAGRVPQLRSTVKRLLAVVLLLLLTGCGDTKIYCGVPDGGGNVNLLGRQNNGLPGGQPTVRFFRP